MVWEPLAAALGPQGRVCPRRRTGNLAQVPRSESWVVSRLQQVQARKPTCGIFVYAGLVGLFSLPPEQPARWATRIQRRWSGFSGGEDVYGRDTWRVRRG